MEQKQNKSKAGQYLTFVLKGQRYGVPISSVREINRVSTITPVPQTPSYMVGVINLRGKVIPVVDLRLKFGMEQAEHTRETCIIVIESVGGQTGMIVDSVSEVVDFTDAQIEPPPSVGDSSRTSFVTGMGKTENRIIILLNVVEALGTAEIHQLDSMSQAA